MSKSTNKPKKPFNGKQLFENFKTFAFGAGGAVVIIGALMKLTHMELLGLNGNVVLGVGLGTEAFIFLISAFDFEKVEGSQPETTHHMPAKTAMSFNFLEETPAKNAVLEKESQKEITASAGNIAKNLSEIETFTDELSKVLGSRNR